MAALRILALALVAAPAAGVGMDRHSSSRRLHRQQPTADQLLGEKVVSAVEDVLSAPKGPKSGGIGAANYPVQVQVEDKAIKETQKKLSAGCGKRFSQMMEGKGPSMSSFKKHATEDEKSKKEAVKACDELKGKVCHTHASILQSEKAPDGRKLSQAVAVEGNSCLPTECTNSQDLGHFASFMRGQTKEVIPGADIGVSLNVDCSASGGSSVNIAGDGSYAQAPPRSQGGAVVPSALAALAVVALVTA